MKQISQETFDEMVEENIDAFELEPEEALRAAIEELELQGVDLSMIVKALPGTNLDDHPIAVATKKLGSADSKDRESSLQDLEKIFQKEASSMNELIAISGKFDTLSALLSMFDDVSNSLKSQHRICAVLKALLIDSTNMKSKFLELNGPEKLLNHSQNKDLLSSLLEVIVAACKKHEPSKCKFMAPEMLEVFSACLESVDHVEVVFQVLATLTTPDDPQTSASQAFLHARLLAQQKFHLKAVTILQTESKKATKERDSSVLICGLDAVRCLAANDEICKEICEANGIEVCMELYKTSSSNSEITKTLNNAIRQLACSDLVKQTIMSLNGAAIIAELLTVFEKNGVVIEGLLGLMTVVTLRQPQFARAFCEEKCHESIKSVMVNFQSDPKVLRQGCLCIRNFVVRDPTIKEWMIKLDIEPWIRKCKEKFKKECGSEASSALRDLGFDDYK